MADSSGLNEARGLEAALSLVDESLLNVSAATALPSTPSFDVECVDTFWMVPFKHIESLRVNASTAGFQAPQRPARKANPNGARDDVKYDLVYLREKVNALEAELQSLRLNSRRMENAAGSIGRVDSVPRVWEEMSTRQKRHRDRAEHENARLRVLVQRKQKMMNGLCAVLQKRIQQQSTKCSSVVEFSQCSIRVMDFEGDMGGFQDLFQRLEAAYEEIHDVFAEARLSDYQIGSEVIHVLKSADDNHIELLASKELPFRMGDTGEAAWDLFKGVEKHDNGRLYGKTMKNLEQPFTILEDFQKEVFSKNLRADVRAKQLVRRCVEPDQDMILFASSMTPIEIKHKAVEGVTYHVREYVLTKRAEDSSPEHELSLLQLCTRISIECNPGTTFDAAYLRSVAKFWIGNIGGNFRCYLARIENALVDRALTGQLMQQ